MWHQVKNQPCKMQILCYLGKKISCKKKEAIYLYPVKKKLWCQKSLMLKYLVWATHCKPGFCLTDLKNWRALVSLLCFEVETSTLKQKVWQSFSYRVRYSERKIRVLSSLYGIAPWLALIGLGNYSLPE